MSGNPTRSLAADTGAAAHASPGLFSGKLIFTLGSSPVKSILTLASPVHPAVDSTPGALVGRSSPSLNTSTCGGLGSAAGCSEMRLIGWAELGRSAAGSTGLTGCCCKRAWTRQ